MAFSNLGFEDEDPALDGLPDVWTVATVAAAEEAAAFDRGQTTPPAFPDPYEAFGGGWSTNETYTFAYADPIDLGEIFPAFFDDALPDPESVEDFEEGWSTNQSYLFSWGSEDSAGLDDFETGWDNVPYALDWGDVAEDPADFDTGTPEAVEDFEEEWDTNESFQFVLGATTAASFDDGGTPEAVEDFEEVNALKVVSVAHGIDTFTATAHGMSNGEVVTFENTGGQLPSGISPNTQYFVITAAANSFQVSATLGGPSIDFTDNGTGTHRVRPDVTAFWTSLMATL